ncbi:MAG: glycosyltransferase family 4 protein [Desulfobacteraceae bacterium]|nr:glycosyltransferase family 4 protein [Desulfobacteraceae bacterium]
MNKKKFFTIGFPHKPPEHGGPGSFQTRFEHELKLLGWRVVYPEDRITPDVIMVVGGTRKLWWLWKNKRKGVVIIHRLDGLNWQHRLLPFSQRINLKVELANKLLRFIRNKLADQIIYQSEFVRDWWHEYAGNVVGKEHIIYNAVDINDFKPSHNGAPEERMLVCVEGTVQSVDAYICPVETLSKQLFEKGLIAGTIVCGRMQTVEAQQRLESCPGIVIKGMIPRDKIASVFQNAVYLVLEVHPACPNSIIEAMACGTPVIGFDTGSFRELVPPDAGICVPYGANPWKLEQPDIPALLKAAEQVINNWEQYSKGARAVAEERFNIKDMTKAYIQTVENVIEIPK